jgi:putative Mg2+ transporter-C (MgtC) family protein
VEDLFSAQLWIKLLLAFGCGAAIGIERELSDKPAGLRTNMLICVGSTLITMMSLHVALTYASRQINIADPARITAQIVSGIGFLGAGTIIQARGSVHGLTTAATIWVMAGIGIAIGSGAYGAAVATTVLLLAILYGLRWVEVLLLQRQRHFVHFRVTGRRDAEIVPRLNRLADEQHLALDHVKLSRRGETLSAEFALTLDRSARDALVTGLLDLDAVEDVHVSE